MTEKIEKLSKWAQEHIRTLKYERDTAVRALNNYVDGQTESPFYYDDVLSLGERRTEKGIGGPTFKRVYVQAHMLEVKYAGVHLSVLLRDNEQIDLQWHDSGDLMREVALIPESFQKARLKAQEHMR